MENLPFMLFTAAGIGFIIFIHELGHFLAARSVGVRVEAFSIGFGPRLLAWTRGGTQYRLGLIPLGGYVKMAGEDPTRPTTGKQDEFGSKTVAQRVLVISAGVIMNMIFALVAIPVAFTIGVPFESPEIGYVQQGGVAWRAGILPGDRVLSINGRRVLTFEDIPLDLAVASGPVDIELRRGERTMHVNVTPEPDPVRGVPMIGVSPAASSVRIAASTFTESDSVSVARARQLEALGLGAGTEIVRLNGLPYRRDLWDTEASSIRSGDRSVSLEVRDGEGIKHVVLQPVLDTDPKDGVRIGVALRRDRVAQVRPGTDAATAGLQPGDVLMRVNGRALESSTALPELIGNGADPRRDDADKTQRPLELVVQRGTQEVVIQTAPLGRKERAAFLSDVVWEARNALTIDVLPGSVAAKVGLQSGDQVLRAAGASIATWDAFREAIQASENKALKLQVQRGAALVECEVQPRREAENAVLPILEEVPLSETVCLPVMDAITTGFVHTGRVVRRVVETLRSVITGRVSGKHLGGIITIFRASVTYSQIAVTRGLLFMALVSINLAILNILPIPVLDGGWLMFLIIERIRRKPLPERAMVWFQYGGLVLVLGLMLYVTWNDIARLVGWM